MLCFLYPSKVLLYFFWENKVAPDYEFICSETKCLVERNVEELVGFMSVTLREMCKTICMKWFPEMAEKLRRAGELRKLNNQYQCSTCKASRSGDLPKCKVANATTYNGSR